MAKTCGLNERIYGLKAKTFGFKLQICGFIATFDNHPPRNGYQLNIITFKTGNPNDMGGVYSEKGNVCAAFSTIGNNSMFTYAVL